jgi:hypothetical protein
VIFAKGFPDLVNMHGSFHSISGLHELENIRIVNVNLTFRLKPEKKANAR